jgi:DNA mismatch endonuclease (patch repair protein)
VTDNLSEEVRRKTMRRVKSFNTAPEIAVRRTFHRFGARYRLDSGHRLPGSPDLVLPSRTTVVFVHGCFWHQHNCGRGARRPKSNTEYWDRKLESNLLRDKRCKIKLQDMGWRVIIVWECEIADQKAFIKKVKKILGRSCMTRKLGPSGMSSQ